MLAEPGGTVDLGSEGTLSYLTDERNFSLQPKHKYILVLHRHSAGDFYTLRGDWDVTDGFVKPNSALETERTSKGNSVLAGLLIEKAIEQIKRQVSPS